jgi:hypothetical protein
LAVDRVRCNFRRHPVESVKGYHDAIQRFVQGGTIPENLLRQANNTGYAATIEGYHEPSASDEAACCRVIARGNLISGRLSRPCP